MRASLRVAAFVVLLALTLIAQEQAPFRSGVNFVRVDVLVTTGNGAPVIDLTRDDFEVTEDGRPQSIEQFRLVRVDGNPDPRNPLPEIIRSRDDEAMIAARDDVRVFAFLLDDYHVRPTAWREARDELIRFVRTQFRPNDVVAVMDPATPVNALTFTRDHESIVSAMRAFEGRRCEPEIHGTSCQAAYLPPRNLFEREYAYLGRGVVERVRREVTISALQGLSVRLGSLREGRKALIFVSEGFGGSQSLLLREVYRDANRHNTAIYTVDPGRLRPGRVSRGNQETLRVLAEETGGRAILNTNALGEGLTSAVRDASTYYLLGYSSTASQNDGRFHEVKVRVKRRGVDVHARKGYWAMSEADAERAAAAPSVKVVTPAQRALGSLAAADANRFVYRWVGTERAADGRMRVTVVWEPKADTRRQKGEQPGRVNVVATSEGGQEIFSGGGPATAAHAQAFDTAPGRKDLRLTIAAAANGETIDRDQFTIEVPDLTEPGSLSTPRVFRARTVSEFRSLVAGGALPTARREFLRSDRLLVRFDTSAEDVKAALVNATGRKLVDLTVAQAATGGTHQVDLALGAFSQGEYVLEITAGENAEFVPFRIVG